MSFGCVKILKKHKLSQFDPNLVVGFRFRLLSDLSFGFLTWLPLSSLSSFIIFLSEYRLYEKKFGGQNFMSPWTQLWMVVPRCNVMSFFSSNSFFTVKFLIGLYCIWTIGRYDLSSFKYFNSTLIEENCQLSICQQNEVSTEFCGNGMLQTKLTKNVTCLLWSPGKA